MLMDPRSERRNHLDLQINLLAEKEATSILKVLRDIADHLKIDVTDDAEHEELALRILRSKASPAIFAPKEKKS